METKISVKVISSEVGTEDETQGKHAIPTRAKANTLPKIPKHVRLLFGARRI
jgi:hypothetical protein